VLVVDDEPGVLELLAKHPPMPARTSALTLPPGGALELMDTRAFDLTIPDIAMPHTVAARRCASWREPQCGGAVPATALTACARFVGRVLAAAAGFQCHAVQAVEPLPEAAARCVRC
jgi:CheY-like chemotaxis protein